jgi:hypothetical protein
MPRKIKRFGTPLCDRMARDWPTTGAGLSGGPAKKLSSTSSLGFIRRILV